jgi:membrane protease subunit (stomatin/prohibitin family)
MEWGTPAPISMRDPVTDILITVSANGAFEVRISDPNKFYREVVKHQKNYTMTDLRKRLLDTLMYEFRPALAKTMMDNRYTFDVIDAHIKDIGSSIEPALRKIFLNDYGIEMTKFIIKYIGIPANQKTEIENMLKEIKYDYKEEEKKRKAKIELREELEILERLKDKDWEKEKYLLELKARDYQRYLDVCKIIGWDSGDKKETAAVQYCGKCGKPLAAGVAFCNYCGTQASGKKICVCGKENSIDSAFCGGCGQKLM